MSQDKNLSGASLGQYEIKALIGTGAMGAVYRAHQPALKRDVAIKVLTTSALTTQPDYLERFSREAQTAAALEHPNIVPIYDYGNASGTPYVAMRLLTGGSLEDRLELSRTQDHPLPTPPEIADILKQIASALDYAHSKGVVHRDIKPSNIMFDSRGVPFIVDFGIVRLLNNKSTLTMSGFVAGTPPFIPPEQWLNQDVGPAADQYAVGIVVYAMLSGKLPFDAPTIYQLIQQHIHEAPPPLADEELNIVVQRALSKDPQDRYPTIHDFAQAFAEVAGSSNKKTGFFTIALPDKKTSAVVPIPAPFLPPTTVTAPAQPFYRNPVAMSAFTLMLLLILGITAIALSVINEETRENDTRLESTSAALAITQTAIVAASLPTPTPNPTLIAEEIAQCQATNPPPGRQGLIAYYSSGTNNRFDLYLMEADGSNIRRLTNFNADNPRLVRWSHDGTRLLFSASVEGVDQLFTIDVTQSEMTPVQLTTGDTNYNYALYSPDDSLIAFTGQRSENMDIYVMSSDGSNLKRLTEHSSMDFIIGWSPDNTQVLFMSERDGNPEIYSVNINGGNLRALTNTPDMNELDAIWLPNDNILIARSPNNIEQQLSLLKPDGTEIALTTPGVDYTVVDITPDFKTLLIFSDLAGSYDLYTADLRETEIGELRRITYNQTVDFSIDFSGDQTQIVYMVRDGLNSDIATVDICGGNVQKLTDNNSMEYFPIWQPMVASQ